MLWFWPKFLSKSDESVSSIFCPLAVYIFILEIKPNTATHTILTSTPYFIFPRLHILHFRQACHVFVASWKDSFVGCKLNGISVENIHTQAIFWIVSMHLMFSGLFYDQSYPVHYYLPLTILFALSLAQTKGQIRVIHMEDLWGHHCHCPNFQLYIHQTPEYVCA
jgi:hypothetical protein